jgi:hypothetical protein
MLAMDAAIVIHDLRAQRNHPPPPIQGHHVQPGRRICNGGKARPRTDSNMLTFELPQFLRTKTPQHSTIASERIRAARSGAILTTFPRFDALPTGRSGDQVVIGHPDGQF